jgi:hypothetical protein
MTSHALILLAFRIAIIPLGVLLGLLLFPLGNDEPGE